LLLAIIAWELGGIWTELKGVRNEQVKNALYALPAKQAEHLRSQVNSKGAQHQLRLLASEIAGIDNAVDVNIDQPLSVEIDNEPVNVEIDR
jgi:hypothetical protein